MNRREECLNLSDIFCDKMTVEKPPVNAASDNVENASKRPRQSVCNSFAFAYFVVKSTGNLVCSCKIDLSSVLFA